MKSNFKFRLQRAFDYLFVDHAHILLSWLLLVFVGVVIYRNSFGVPFLFDDITQIVFNSHIQTLEWPWRFLENTRRPFLYATLAFNFHHSEFNTFGYHIFNIRVHLLAAMFLFLLIYKTCRLPKIGEVIQKEATLLALGASLLWVCHPIQTQAVTYLIQRAESLMGLLFILTLVLSAKYLTSRNIAWLIVAGLFALLCGLTKEVALSLPIVVLLYDRAFVSNSFRDIWIKNNKLYLSLCITWLAMAVLFFTTPAEHIPTAGFAVKGLTPWQYLLNQPKVIVHYLYLVIWPNSLIFDYHWPLIQNISKLLPFIGIIVAIIMTCIAIYRRYPTISFLGLSFFIILAPSSSFIPLKDLIYEYRIYLPLSCLTILFILLLRVIIKKRLLPNIARNALFS